MELKLDFDERLFIVNWNAGLRPGVRPLSRLCTTRPQGIGTDHYRAQRLIDEVETLNALVACASARGHRRLVRRGTVLQLAAESVSGGGSCNRASLCSRIRLGC